MARTAAALATALVVGAPASWSCSGEVTGGGHVDSAVAEDASAPGDGALPADADTGADGGAVPDGGGEIIAPPGYPNLLFHDEFDTGPLSIGIEAGTTWAPGWITWNTRHLSGNSDDCWEQHDGEEGWTSSWTPSGRTIGEALRSDAGFVAAHGNGPYNHEVSEGTLKMRALRVPAHLRDSDFGGFEFTGGMISTEDRFWFVNGWMEIRLRFNRVEQGMHFGLWRSTTSGSSDLDCAYAQRRLDRAGSHRFTIARILSAFTSPWSISSSEPSSPRK